MSILPKRHPAGIALIIVMLVITVLGMLAAVFINSMKVETSLARNVGYESDMLWLGVSGVELGRYVLGQQMLIPEERSFDALDQVWAGGPGGTNELLADIQLRQVKLGPGMFSVDIIDMERKFNINFAPPELVDRALNLIGVDSLASGEIVASLEDWRDRDTLIRINGGESDYYLGLEPAYYAKDGPLDDITELLRIKGISREVFWGLNRVGLAIPESAMQPGPIGLDASVAPLEGLGLVDFFNCSGRPQININTASPETLQLLPGIDPGTAMEIVRFREESPFHSVGELISVPGMLPQYVDALRRFCGVKSFEFEARVTIEMPPYRRVFVALLTRRSATSVQVMNVYWE